jgi:alpha-galactosidase
MKPIWKTGVVAALAVSLAAVAEDVPLSKLNLKLMSTGWDRPVAGKSIEKKPLQIGGKQFADGVGTHAPSAMLVQLDGKGKRFAAQVGVDSEVGKSGSVEFKVWGDGKLLASSGVVKGGEAAKPLDVDLTGVKTMKLEVSDAGDDKNYDHADWGDARISMEGGKPVAVPDGTFIEVPTHDSLLVYRVSPKGRLQQAYLGGRQPLGDVISGNLDNAQALPVIGSDSEVQFWGEPALQATHADGNPWVRLVYQKHTITPAADGSTLTRITLKDPLYAFETDLCIRAWPEQDLFEQWTEIRNNEPGAITVSRFASAALPLRSNAGFWLTSFSGQWAGEVNITEEKLAEGSKQIDSKLGITTSMSTPQHFLVALDGPAKENSGRVLGASLAWSGNFQFNFQVEGNRLTALAGMNPFASDYKLDAGKTLVTPALLYTFSDQGKGEVSRRFHRWALKHGIRGGDKPHLTVLNNWEATGFDVSEKRIVTLLNNSKSLGMELFLLDDGWFGSPEKAAILGDWRVSPKMLPNGLKPLIDASAANHFVFGIWVEMEMTSPQAPVTKEHPEWILADLRREVYRQRGWEGGGRQWVLDLANPAVQDFVYTELDKLLSGNPGIGYVKWDCNSAFHNPVSSYLGTRQSNLWIDYTNGLYAVMAKIAAKHPKVQMMVCSGGGGRVDYGALRYFDEFWPSDNTNAMSRVKIQWGYSHFFPAKATSAHVTHWDNPDFKFAFDVAMSARLGMDIDATKMKPEEKAIALQAIPLYQQRLRPIVQEGDLYRLLSPYEGPRSALGYVLADKSQAVFFAFQTEKDPQGDKLVLKPEGLDPAKTYTVEEVNLKPGSQPRCAAHGQKLTGAALMKDGLSLPLSNPRESAVIVLKGE